jgi:hypothetical protein
VRRQGMERAPLPASTRRNLPPTGQRSGRGCVDRGYLALSRVFLGTGSDTPKLPPAFLGESTTSSIVSRPAPACNAVRKLLRPKQVSTAVPTRLHNWRREPIRRPAPCLSPPGRHTSGRSRQHRP